MSQIFLPFMDGCEDEIFSKLKKEVDEVCHQIAEKYNVFDSKGRPKKSFILDVLARNFCPYCIIKELTQMRRDEDVDAIYKEGHNLTLNLLIEALRYGLNSSGVSAVVEGEVKGEYGRADIVVRACKQGILIELGNLAIIVEVKTGMSISLAQILKYAMERPQSIIVVWRVKLRQVFIIDMKSHSRLLLAFMFAIVSRGKAVLSYPFGRCCHNNENISEGTKEGGMENPQQYIDELFYSLPKTLPEIVEAVIGLIKARLSPEE